MTTLNFKILHIRGQQDANEKYEELHTPAQLNINANTLATTHTKTPINTHILSVPFAIYVNKKYIPYKFERGIRSN